MAITDSTHTKSAATAFSSALESCKELHTSLHDKAHVQRKLYMMICVCGGGGSFTFNPMRGCSLFSRLYFIVGVYFKLLPH